MSFRNRCVVAGANGPINLSVPIEGGRNSKLPMKEVRIRNQERWQTNHWRTIFSAYNRSPWFEHFAAELEELYTRRFNFLVDWNMACFGWTADKMAINTPVSLSEVFIKNYPEDEYLDWRGRYIPAMIHNLDEEAPAYRQVFEERHGFIPNLSVLDFLFCHGPVRM